MARKTTAHLSPSEYHRWRLDRMEPTLAFDASDIPGWRRKLRRKLKQLIGYPPDPDSERCNLNVRSLWKREHEYGTIERIVFTAEPYSDVPAYLCLPADAQPPYPWFICLQGHSTGMHNSIGVAFKDETTPIDIPGDRDFAIGCMQRGIAALCIEQRSFGYRREHQLKKPADHMCHDAVCHALQLGTTLLAERVFDVDRAIDYLYSRDDVDRKRLGVMGNSGGGTVSVFSAALLPRLTHTMPSCYFCSFRDSILSVYHCADNYIPRLGNQAEMADILGLFAPKPVVVVAGREDPIFPIKATRRQFRRLKDIYAAHDAAEQCKLVVGPEGHRFYADPAWRAMLPLLRKP